MELKRNFKNGHFLICSISVAICFVIGYILLISIDKIENPSIQSVYHSIYTVYTQFGPLIFSVIVLHVINVDYKEKNILFYKLVGYNWLRYYVTKLAVALLGLTIPTIISALVVSGIYNNFSYFLVMSFYFTSVLVHQVLIASLLGFLFKNLIVGFVITLFSWLASIMASTTSKSLSFLAYYDASNQLYHDLGEYLTTNDNSYLAIGENSLYSAVLFAAVIGLVCIFRKRWERNGI